jgi:hypothetical protein
MHAAQCPFCGALAPGPRCPTCGRDPTAPRMPCPRCGRMRPSAEPACLHCGGKAGSDLSWKIPVIVAIFVAAIVISVLVHLAR